LQTLARWRRAAAQLRKRIHLNKLSGGGSGAVERMIAKDKDQGQKLRGRAAIYDPIIRTALEVLKIDTDFKL
jgi:hypothetical protein